MSEEEKIEELHEVVAEEAKLEVEKDVLTEIPEEEAAVVATKMSVEIDAWKPKTDIGIKVKAGTITDIDEILDNGFRILEPQIIEILVPNLESELLMVGQSKGKFGGGARRIFRQTQKKTTEGNKPSFACFAVVGNKDGYVGAGTGKSKDTVPAREKAMRNAKLNVFRIRRGCGSWECGCKMPHTIPFKVEGKCGSTRIVLKPAPRGKGLCIESECAKILRLAGIKDVWSKTYGQTRTKINLIKACINALKELTKVKITKEGADAVGLLDGKIVSSEK